MTWPPPTHDTAAAKVARTFAPRFSYCLRCGYPWSRVESHSTPYSHNSACFPLCEGCWELLGHPEARIPYYAALLNVWAAQGAGKDLAEVRRGLTESVAAGL